MNQDETPQKLLFVGSRNKIRSLTAERMLSGDAGFAVRSAGTSPSARIRVTPGHIGWADTIFVMESRHRDQLKQRFGAELRGKRLIVLHIPDDYVVDEPALLAALRERLSQHLGTLQTEPPNE